MQFIKHELEALICDAVKNLARHRDYFVETVCISQHRPVPEDLFTVIDVAVNGERSKLSPIFEACFSPQI